LDLQTLETTRRLGEVDRELILDLMNKFFARQAAGDIDQMLELVAPDIVCFPNTTWRHAHYPRRIVGKEALREALHQRHINYVLLETVSRRTLIDGDQAVVHRTQTLRERGSGVRHTFDCIDFLRFRDGLITEFCELPDGSAYSAVVHFPH
jgi:ketosteroid isomerase-like protein